MGKPWNKRDEELALCIGFLKLGAKVASDLRDSKAKGAPPPTDGLAALVTMALQSFPSYQASDSAIRDLAKRCGFELEEHFMQTPAGVKPS